MNDAEKLQNLITELKGTIQVLKSDRIAARKAINTLVDLNQSIDISLSSLDDVLEQAYDERDEAIELTHNE